MSEELRQTGLQRGPTFRFPQPTRGKKLFNECKSSSDCPFGHQCDKVCYNWPSLRSVLPIEMTKLDELQRLEKIDQMIRFHIREEMKRSETLRERLNELESMMTDIPPERVALEKQRLESALAMSRKNIASFNKILLTPLGDAQYWCHSKTLGYLHSPMYNLHSDCTPQSQDNKWYTSAEPRMITHREKEKRSETGETERRKRSSPFLFPFREQKEQVQILRPKRKRDE